MSGDKDPQYDISKKNREILEWKNARRLQLRQQLIKEQGHPSHHNLVFDEYMFRYGALRTLYEHRFQPHRESGLFALGFFTCLALGFITFRRSALKENHRAQRGEIAYEDKAAPFR